MEFSDQILFQFCSSSLYQKAGLAMTITWYVPIAWGGKFHHSDLGSTISASSAWFFLEIPALVLTLLIFPFGQHATNPKAWILITPYLIHYFHRAIIYPRLLRSKFIHGYPIIILVANLTMKLMIIYVQAREISHYKDYDNDRFPLGRVLGGLSLFVWGLWIRIWADTILPRLKGEDGTYKVPKGGWFELVSCPHYLGECMEWLGWSIMTGSLATLAFFVLSFCILVPRAYCTHKWYLAKFKDYPKTRKAIIPFLF